MCRLDFRSNNQKKNRKCCDGNQNLVKVFDQFNSMCQMSTNKYMKCVCQKSQSLHLKSVSNYLSLL